MNWNYFWAVAFALFSVDHLYSYFNGIVDPFDTFLLGFMMALLSWAYFHIGREDKSDD